jgi:hypothetical protein
VIVFVLDKFGNGSFYLPHLRLPMLVQVVEAKGLVALHPNE